MEQESVCRAVSNEILSIVKVVLVLSDARCTYSVIVNGCKTIGERRPARFTGESFQHEAVGQED